MLTLPEIDLCFDDGRKQKDGEWCQQEYAEQEHGEEEQSEQHGCTRSHRSVALLFVAYRALDKATIKAEKGIRIMRRKRGRLRRSATRRSSRNNACFPDRFRCDNQV